MCKRLRYLPSQQFRVRASFPPAFVYRPAFRGKAVASERLSHLRSTGTSNAPPTLERPGSGHSRFVGKNGSFIFPDDLIYHSGSMKSRIIAPSSPHPAMNCRRVRRVGPNESNSPIDSPPSAKARRKSINFLESSSTIFGSTGLSIRAITGISLAL